jgi:YHS domain-containing protein
MKRICLALMLAGAAFAADAPKKTAEAKDPVCQMTVDPKTSEKTDYQGKTYYFCSKEDKDSFVKNPGKYVKSEPGSKKKS